MSNEEDIYCSKCNKKTEQALMLTCEHNLCLDCAYKVLTLNNQIIKDFNSSQYLRCDICNSLTELEPETIRQICEENGENNNENYVIDNIDSNYFLDFEDNNNKNNMNQDIVQNNPLNLNNNANQNNNKKYNRENNNNTTSEINIINDLINNNKNICNEHGELLNYLCLDCMSNCVCSECVVHGLHRNHEVLNVKKAYPLIYNKLQDLSKYVNGQIKEVSLKNETIIKKKNFINSLIDRCKNEIHNTFEQIRVRLDNKEKELINNTTNILQKNINELNNYNNLIQKNMTTLGSLIEQINNIINTKNEINTINYYCENKDIILSKAQLNELSNLNDANTFNNIKIEADKITFNKMLEGINNFRFNINNMNAIDINNRNQFNNNTNRNNKKNMYMQNNNNYNMRNNMYNNINNNQNIINNNQIIQNNNNYVNQRKKRMNINQRKMNNNPINNNMGNYQNNFNDNMNIDMYEMNDNNQNY